MTNVRNSSSDCKTLLSRFSLSLSLSLCCFCVSGLALVAVRKRSRHAKVMSLVWRVRLPYSACIPSLRRGYTTQQKMGETRNAADPPPFSIVERRRKTLNGPALCCREYLNCIDRQIYIRSTLYVDIIIIPRQSERPRSLPGRGEVIKSRIRYQIAGDIYTQIDSITLALSVTSLYGSIQITFSLCSSIEGQEPYGPSSVAPSGSNPAEYYLYFLSNIFPSLPYPSSSPFFLRSLFSSVVAMAYDRFYSGSITSSRTYNHLRRNLLSPRRGE